jgi:cytidylate kinase
MGKIVAIDGPGSSGKNSVGLRLAERLGFQFIDSGSIYRALTYFALKNGFTVDDIDRLADRFSECSVTFVDDHGVQRVFLDGAEIGSKLHSAEITRYVPLFAKHPHIRDIVRKKQHGAADNQNIVMAGRDTGTVIFPEAQVKFYISASAEVRAKRRYQQLLSEGITADYDEILAMLIDRDHQDSTRANSPLKPAEDAIVIDSSELNVLDVVEKMYVICKTKHL